MGKSNSALFITNTLFNTGLKIISQIISFFILPLFIKNLGAELYGIWALTGIILGYMGILDMGFGSGITKYISEAYAEKNIERLKNVINTGVFLYFCIGFIILLVCIFFNSQILHVFSIKPGNIQVGKNLLVIAGFFAVIRWPMKIINSAFKGLLKFKALSMLSTIQSIGSTIVMLYCVYANWSIEKIAIIYNITNFVLWLPLYFFMKKYIHGFSLGIRSINLKIVKEIAPFSLGVFISQIISMLSLQVDVIIIGIFLSMSAITAYSVASKLFYVSWGYVGLLCGAIWPTIFTASALDNKPLIKKMLKKGSKYIAMIASSMGYLGIVVSPLFIELWMGQEYVQYAIWSQVFMLVLLTGPGLTLASDIVMASGKCREVNIVETFKLLINLAISISLIHILGMGGPILGTVISRALLAIIVFPYFSKVIGIEWKVPFITVYKVVGSNLPAFLIFFLISKKIEATWLGLILLSTAMMITQYLTFYYFFFAMDEKRDLKMLLENFGIETMMRKIRW
ncbi:hypothetical protein CVT91_00230 [Candidatus Atribacteria bacterium HGW-Atribacteria-1]|nr:MAG: hypothetical protein CVT91_00230 [Candidatus Atribacteria bacterium HGW-Atribacteria-1]